MRKKAIITRLVLTLLLVAISSVGVSGRVAAQAPATDLSARVQASDPTRPSITLTNSSSKACQVATTAQGTVAITQVTQNGKTIAPVAIDAAADEDLGYLLHAQLKTLQPGASVDVPLQVYKLRAGHVLRATTWSSDGGVFAVQYPINAKGPLQLALSYSVPITPAKGAPACGTVLANTLAADAAAATKVGFIGVGIVVVVLIVLAVWWWLRKRRRRATVAAMSIALLLGIGIWWQQAPSAYADVVVPPDMQAAFDGCMSTFNANRDITGPVLDAINNPANRIEIVRTSGGSETTGYRVGGGANFTIYWNPNDRHAYAGTGGNADPCTSLYHEMYHVLDMHNGTFSRADCAGSGIETKEVMATRAQNLLRERLGMPARSHYGDRPLPSGDCTAPLPSGTCTGGRCGDTNGDPHLRTFDGLRYDFQATGEFIAARNPAGTFEMQVRQEPWLDSRHVSMNTAVVFRVQKDRVELRAGKTTKLLVNGKSKPLAATTLPDGGQLELVGNTAVIRWPDGSEVFVRPVGPWGLAIAAQPAEAHAGKLEGLLGDADGESKNDVRARNSNTVITRPTHQALYPDFADSWRISDKTSLFTYERGKNTASYTDRSFPDELPDPKRLPGYAAAERFCKSLGITDAGVLANCALDMAITGRSEFAKAALHSQTFAAGADFGGTTWQLRIKNPGDTAEVTFAATAGEKIFVAVPTATLPSQCGILRLFAPNGDEITSGCIINGVGNIDGKTLTDAGTYTLRLSPHTATGTATIQLLRITDKQGVIVPDGPRITARIDRPGVVGRYTFTAQAGQRVYIDVPASTLPSLCGGLRLIAPDGKELNSGCIINGKGNIDTTVLPAAGQYTVVVDPADAITGQATLRLIVATAESRPITINGPTLTANLQKPGSIALFTFAGTAGQRIFVDIPSSELPSQCGILVLQKPDGGTIGSGCVINHTGDISDDGIVLPVTGPYTLILNPNDDATGKTTILVRSR